MMVIVFRTRLNDVVGDEYGRRADDLAAIASSLPGFVSSKDFQAEDGERATIIEFRSAEELEVWRNHPVHRAAQADGRLEYYREYSLQVCEVVRESKFTRSPSS